MHILWKKFDNDDFFGLQFFIWSGAWKIFPQVHLPMYYYKLNSMYYSTGYYLCSIVQFTTLVLLASYYYIPLPNIIWVLVYHCSTCTYLHTTTNLLSLYHSTGYYLCTTGILLPHTTTKYHLSTGQCTTVAHVPTYILLYYYHHLFTHRTLLQLHSKSMYSGTIT